MKRIGDLKYKNQDVGGIFQLSDGTYTFDFEVSNDSCLHSETFESTKVLKENLIKIVTEEICDKKIEFYSELKNAFLALKNYKFDWE